MRITISKNKRAFSDYSIDNEYMLVTHVCNGIKILTLLRSLPKKFKHLKLILDIEEI
jgi:hypothetical protein